MLRRNAFLSRSLGKKITTKVRHTWSDAYSSPVLYLPCAVPIEPKRQVVREPGWTTEGYGGWTLVGKGGKFTLDLDGIFGQKILDHYDVLVRSTILIEFLMLAEVVIKKFEPDIFFNVTEIF